MLKKNLFVIVALLSLGTLAQAQDKYFTKTGKITFSSKAPLEDIEAKNKTAAAIIDIKTGAIQFSVLMKGFEFEKALMQEHFNENYVESNKYPKAEFKGAIVNNKDINYTKDGTYPAIVKGQLTIHGVTQTIEAPGTIKVADGKIEATSTFNIRLSDYKISIPSVVKDKINNNVKVSVDTKLDPYKG
jgi:polyisoprenoid-binding protein YceI